MAVFGNRLGACCCVLALSFQIGCSKPAVPTTAPEPPKPPTEIVDPTLVKESEAGAVKLIEDAGGKVIRHITSGHVVEVNLLGCRKFGDAELKQLAILKRLRDLNLSDTSVTDAGFADLKPFPNLEMLLIGSPNVTGAGIKELRDLKGLRLLNLSSAKVTDAGLADISALSGSELKELILKDADITDAPLKEIAKLNRLEILDLSGAKKITDAGIRELLTLDKLRTLRISDTGVTDAGLMQLTKLKDLETLFVIYCKVTDPGVRKFEAAMPKCTVIRKPLS